MGIKIISTGKYQPELILNNEDLSKMVDTNHDWIVERTGIVNRRIATTQTTTDLAVLAGEQALEGIDKDTIDLVVVSTVTPDKVTPFTAAQIKRTMGLKNAKGFDINAACSGFVYNLWITSSLMEQSQKTKHKINRAIIIGAERLSRITDYTDRNTCILFGDGAGAIVLEYDENATGIIGTMVRNIDDVENSLTCGNQFGDTPFSKEETETPYLKMAGTKVFKFAVKTVSSIIMELLDDEGITVDELDHIVLHQANLRIMQGIASKMNIPMEKFQVSIQDMGNVSSATIPMAFDDLYRSGKLKKGQKVLLAGFGGGLSAAAAIIEI